MTTSYHAGYNPAAPGLDEARLDAYRKRIVSRLDLLNIAIARDDAAPVAAVNEKMVEIGDSATLWDLESGPIRIRIRGGDDDGGLDFESEITGGVQGNAGVRYTFYTHLFVYLHPDALAHLPARRESDARERLLSRINDWLTLGVCNYWDPESQSGGLVVDLDSSILTPPPGHDALLESHVWRGYREWSYRGFGNAEIVPALHLIIRASIE